MQGGNIPDRKHLSAKHLSAFKHHEEAAASRKEIKAETCKAEIYLTGNIFLPNIFLPSNTPLRIRLQAEKRLGRNMQGRNISDRKHLSAKHLSAFKHTTEETTGRQRRREGRNMQGRNITDRKHLSAKHLSACKHASRAGRLQAEKR